MLIRAHALIIVRGARRTTPLFNRSERHPVAAGSGGRRRRRRGCRSDCSGFYSRMSRDAATQFALPATHA